MLKNFVRLNFKLSKMKTFFEGLFTKIYKGLPEPYNEFKNKLRKVETGAANFCFQNSSR